MMASSSPVRIPACRFSTKYSNQQASFLFQHSAISRGVSVQPSTSRGAVAVARRICASAGTPVSSFGHGIFKMPWGETTSSRPWGTRAPGVLASASLNHASSNRRAHASRKSCAPFQDGLRATATQPQLARTGLDEDRRFVSADQRCSASQRRSSGLRSGRDSGSNTPRPPTQSSAIPVKTIVKVLPRLPACLPYRIGTLTCRLRSRRSRVFRHSWRIPSSSSSHSNEPITRTAALTVSTVGPSS